MNTSKQRLNNTKISAFQRLISPKDLINNIPVSAKARNTVLNNRKAIERILQREDHRLLVVVGPCSIHDIPAAHDYAKKLRKLAKKLDDTLLIVMRVYFEKPRTSTGWKGLLNDPKLNNSFEVEEGLHLGRQLLHDLAEQKIPTATEALDPIVPQFLQDLVAWSAIGARTTESQTHREMSSGLSTPVGLKNGTDGNLKTAFNALAAVRSPHRFLGIDESGKVSVVHTKGNPFAHIILRGGENTTNFDSVNVSLCEKGLAKANLPPNIMIDASHGNSAKDPARQPLVIDDVIKQILEGNKSIIGVMIESNLFEGNQKMDIDNLSQLSYGVSVTDGCINWKTTEKTLTKMHDMLKEPLAKRIQK